MHSPRKITEFLTHLPVNGLKPHDVELPTSVIVHSVILLQMKGGVHMMFLGNGLSGKIIVYPVVSSQSQSHWF